MDAAQNGTRSSLSEKSSSWRLDASSLPRMPPIGGKNEYLNILFGRGKEVKMG